MTDQLIAQNVRVAVTGGAYTGPTGTDLPTDATSPRDEALSGVGYISEDGIVQSIGSDTKEIKAWQNADTVRVVQTSHTVSYKLTMIETTEGTLRVYYNDAVATLAKVQVTGAQSPHQPWVLEALDGDVVIRVVIPDGQVTERGDVTWKSDSEIGYEITITANPVDGVKAYIYQGVQTPKVVPAGG